MKYQTLDPNEPLKRSYLLYGPSKSGKTVLSAYFPKPLFIVTEPGPIGGLLSIRKFKHPYVKITKWSEVSPLIVQLKKKDPDIETLQISLTFLSKISMVDILEMSNRDSPEIKDWMLNADKVRNAVIRICELPYIPVFECNDHIVTIKGPGREINQVDPDLPGRLARDMPAIIDEVLYTYRERYMDKEVKKFKQRMCLLSCPDPGKGVVIAGDRSDNLDTIEYIHPETMKEDYDKFIEKVQKP